MNDQRAVAENEAKAIVFEYIREWDDNTIEIEWMTDRIASALADAERRGMERAAKVAETLGVHPALNVWDGGPEWYKHGKEIAAEIRAHAQADKEGDT